MKPLLSIVVPTKDRYKYLKHLIELINRFKSDRIELVLQDNTESNREILDFLAKNKYSFIKYQHNANPLPITLNCDLAILNSSGKYVCMIGDDDGVTSHIIKCVQWLDDNQIEALLPTPISYHWPDYISSITGDVSGTLMFNRFSQNCYIKDSRSALNEIIKKGFINRGELPLLYHGIVRRDVLDQIFAIGKTYFPGPSPDIANGVALSLIVKKFVRCDFPIIISGASITHGGGIRKLKNKVASIEDVPFLPSKVKENWESNIPKVWSVQTIWPESAIKSLRYMNREDLILKVNVEYMLANFVTFHLDLGHLAFKITEKKIKLVIYIVRFIIVRYFNGIKRLFARRLFSTNDDKIIKRNIENIEQASAFLIAKEPEFLLKIL